MSEAAIDKEEFSSITTKIPNMHPNNFDSNTDDELFKPQVDSHVSSKPRPKAPAGNRSSNLPQSLTTIQPMTTSLIEQRFDEEIGYSPAQVQYPQQQQQLQPLKHHNHIKSQYIRYPATEEEEQLQLEPEQILADSRPLKRKGKNKKFISQSTERLNGKRPSFHDQMRQDEVRKSNDILVGKLVKILTHNKPSFNQLSQNQRYSAHQAQIMAHLGNQRKSQLQQIMRENFKILERIQKQQSNIMGSAHSGSSANGVGRKYPNHFRITRNLDGLQNKSALNGYLDKRTYHQRSSSVIKSYEVVSLQAPLARLVGPPKGSNAITHKSSPKYVTQSHSLVELPKLPHNQYKQGKDPFSVQVTRLDEILPNKFHHGPQGIKITHRQILENMTQSFERSKVRNYFIKLTQVYNLPKERKVLYHKQHVLPGHPGDHVIEISRTKHKYYITVVKVSNPHKFQVIQLFRKIGDRLIEILDKKIVGLVELLHFANGKTLVVKDIDLILQQHGASASFISGSKQNSKVLGANSSISSDTQGKAHKVTLKQPLPFTGGGSGEKPLPQRQNYYKFIQGKINTDTGTAAYPDTSAVNQASRFGRNNNYAQYNLIQSERKKAKPELTQESSSQLPLNEYGQQMRIKKSRQAKSEKRYSGIGGQKDQLLSNRVGGQAGGGNRNRQFGEKISERSNDESRNTSNHKLSSSRKRLKSIPRKEDEISRQDEANQDLTSLGRKSKKVREYSQEMIDVEPSKPTIKVMDQESKVKL